MKKKIFTLLASALMLFGAAFASYGQPWRGERVPGLVAGIVNQSFHLQVVQLGSNRVEANETDAKSGAVLAVDEAGNLVIRNASYYTNGANLEELYRTLWCVNNQPFTVGGHAARLRFTNKHTLADMAVSLLPPAQQLRQDDADWLSNGPVPEKPTAEQLKNMKNGKWKTLTYYTDNVISGGVGQQGTGVVLGGSALDLWESGNTYDTFADTFFLRIRVEGEEDYYYTLAVDDKSVRTGTDDDVNYDLRNLYLAKVHYNDFEDGAPFAENHLVRFSLIETVPRLLSKDDINKILLKGDGKLTTDRKTAATDPLKNIAEAVDAGSHNHYVRLKHTNGKYITVDSELRYDGTGTRYPEIIAEESSAPSTGEGDFRFLYYPTEGYVIINVRSIVPIEPIDGERKRQTDDVTQKFGEGYWQDSHSEDGLLASDSYFTHTIQNFLTVHVQVIAGNNTTEEVPTVGAVDVAAANGVRIHYYFTLGKEAGCLAIEEDRATLQSALYLVQNADGHYLTVPLYTGGFAPVWLNVADVDVDVPKKSPAYHWFVQNLEGKTDSKVSRVTLINREFPEIKFEYIQLYKTPHVFKESWVLNTGDDDRLYGTLLGAAKLSVSGFSELTGDYIKDPSLGYKRAESVSESYAFKWYHTFAEDRPYYISVNLDNRADTLLRAVNDASQMTYFRFNETEMAGTGAPEEKYGISEDVYDEAGIAKDSPRRPVRLTRSRYKLAINAYSTVSANENILTLSHTRNYVHTKENNATTNELGRVGEFYLRYAYDKGAEPYYTVLQHIDQSDGHNITDAFGYDMSNTLWSSDPASPNNTEQGFGLLLLSVDDRDLMIRATPRYGSNNVPSTFALEVNPEPFYRRLNAAGLGLTDPVDEDKPVVVQIFRSTSQYSAKKDYLYEDQHSAISYQDGKLSDGEYDGYASSAYGNGINFLSWTNKADDEKHAANHDGAWFPHKFGLYVEKAFIDPSESRVKPQYLIAVGVKDSLLGFPSNCPTCTDAADVPEQYYKYGRYLINARDSAYEGQGLNELVRNSKYLSGDQVPRFVFVDAVLSTDPTDGKKKLYILPTQTKYKPDNSGDTASLPIQRYRETLGGDYTAPSGITYPKGTEYLNFKSFVEGRYILDASGNATSELEFPGIEADGRPHVFDVETKDHKPFLFSFRFVDRKEGPTGLFYIESESHVVSDWFAPSAGGWLKTVHDGMVVSSRSRITQAIEEAEKWQLEFTSEEATSTEPVLATSSVGVISGEGSVTILNAAGKSVVITNILGQTIARTVLTSDRATLSAPKGVVLIAVAGEPAQKAIVK